MRLLIAAIAALLIMPICRAETPEDTDTAKQFIRKIVKSLMNDKGTLSFPVADTLFAVDNGEMLTKDQLKKVWPDFAKQAFKKKVSIDKFFDAVNLKIQPVQSNKRMASNKRLMKVYTPQKGDLYVDAGKMKKGKDNLIGYDKAFIYVIRKVKGKWTLIGLGG